MSATAKTGLIAAGIVFGLFALAAILILKSSHPDDSPADYGKTESVSKWLAVYDSRSSDKPVVLDASNVLQQFRDNAIAAEKTTCRRKASIAAQVRTIGRDYDMPCLVVVAENDEDPDLPGRGHHSGPYELRVFFADSDASQLEKLQKGQLVRIEGMIVKPVLGWLFAVGRKVSTIHR